MSIHKCTSMKSIEYPHTMSRTFCGSLVPGSEQAFMWRSVTCTRCLRRGPKLKAVKTLSDAQRRANYEAYQARWRSDHREEMRAYRRAEKAKIRKLRSAKYYPEGF